MQRNVPFRILAKEIWGVGVDRPQALRWYGDITVIARSSVAFKPLNSADNRRSNNSTIAGMPC